MVGRLVSAYGRKIYILAMVGHLDGAYEWKIFILASVGRRLVASAERCNAFG
ncbi:hypothetical protein C1H46_029114 [Malus baccata]|uniref:Uncharacterized protein n=1 Tax=Malus baccata TaxID=106549 RepID=A0A540LFT3_MALBA|nr:hypothetical protein C1H46_029114 [Malus baccata]